MNESRITVDPDGSKWVGVKVSPQLLSVLQDREKLAAFEREVNREFWRQWAKRIDDEMAGLL